ncbi:hypothetical protein [Clostridium sp. BJN0013]|uniref:hypothetical protein n=1 Tax=Clostridium sp. BJN0013 TaxID=3236840 RepID=UPI0034C5C7C8
MQRMKYKLLSTLVIAAPLLLNTGVTTTVHANYGKNSGCNSISNNSRNNTGYSNPSDHSKFNDQGYSDRINTYPVHQYTPTIIHTSCNYSFSDFKTKLDNLVVAGIITQDQETIILNLYYNNKITTGETFKAQLDALVSAGTTTASQEYSILNAFTSWGSNWKIPAPVKPTVPVSNVDNSTTISNTSFSLEDIKTKLDNLVTAGTITQDQKTTILNLFNKGNLTTKNLRSQLNILVIIGVLTQNQAVLIQH